MAKFRKRPVVIDAEQWLGTKESWDRIISMGLHLWRPGEMGSETFIIQTREGDHIARKGDWIIKGIQGEFYPCKPDIFAKTYEPAEESNNGCEI